MKSHGCAWTGCKPVQTVVARGPVSRLLELLEEYRDQLTPDGCFFAMTSTEYDETGDVAGDFLDVIDRADQLGYHYVNTIVYPTTQWQQAAFRDNVRYVVWLCRDRSRMTFHKDVIREKHIWKDVEWGKRAKNYNPKGKDPGNVWIPTEDDGRGHITRHLLLPDERVRDRLLHMTDCGDRCRVIWEELPIVTLPGKGGHWPDAPGPVRGRVVFGTSEHMDQVSDSSVDVAVTSPPYWDLKDYFKVGQIGQEKYPQYLRRMEQVWRECHRVLKDSGSLWVNINIRSHGGKVILLPRDFVIQCRRLGFHYKGILIWHKSSGIPTHDKNIVDRHEYVLVFSKETEFQVDLGRQRAICDYQEPEINGGAFWNINRKAGSVGKKYIHPAIYPNQLVGRVVALASGRRGLALDPFLGSGTSLIAALQNERDFVGYEYNEGFRELMEARFQAELSEVQIDWTKEI